ncbi:MAG: hypothetical protein ACT4QF_09335 [Sporichthyaceae bacterium]
MVVERRKPGLVRDAIVAAFKDTKKEMTVAQVRESVDQALGESIPSSSVRSYLNKNTPGLFERTGRGSYRLVRR